MRYWSRQFEEFSGIDKTDLRAAVDDTDDWIEAQQVNYNNALAPPFKTQATQAQKTLLFCIVAAMRVSPAFARLLIGEVD
jgi:hypothetical protein